MILYSCPPNSYAVLKYILNTYFKKTNPLYQVCQNFLCNVFHKFSAYYSHEIQQHFLRCYTTFYREMPNGCKTRAKYDSYPLIAIVSLFAERCSFNSISLSIQRYNFKCNFIRNFIICKLLVCIVYCIHDKLRRINILLYK